MRTFDSIPHRELDDSICPVCLGGSFEPFIDFGWVPVSGTFLRRPDDSYPKIRLSFEYCTRCAVIRRVVPMDFVSDYRETIHTTGHRRLPYIESVIIPSLKEIGVQRHDRIIEVGANDGHFLDLLRVQGFENLTAVEPSAHSGEILRSKGYRCWQSHFDLNMADEIRRSIGPAAVVFCRHTLEHIRHPHLFVAALASLLAEDGVLFIEVPDAGRIIDNLHGYILWDEHLYNYFPGSLRALFGRSGLEIRRMATGVFRTVRTLLCWARRKRYHGAGPTVDPVAPSLVESCRGFAGRWKAYSARLQAAAQQWPRPIACLGASHPQSNFLIYTGLGASVSFLVDDDPSKVGRYIPLSLPVPVISTDQLIQAASVKTVVRTAFGCDEWMDRIGMSMVTRGSRIVDPYELPIQQDISNSISRIWNGNTACSETLVCRTEDRFEVAR